MKNNLSFFSFLGGPRSRDAKFDRKLTKIPAIIKKIKDKRVKYLFERMLPMKFTFK